MRRSRYLPAPRYPASKGDPLIANLARVCKEIKSFAPGAKKIPIKDARFLSPVAAPSKVIGTPVNYLKHVEEAAEQRDVFTHRYQGGIEEQGLFLKATSSLVGAGEGVKVRFPDRRTDHEMELGVIIGKFADTIPEARALDYVAGYCIALDMVVRGPEDRSFRKSIDTYGSRRSLADHRRRGTRPRSPELLNCSEWRGPASVQYRVHDHEHRAADCLGLDLVSALSGRHHHDRHL